MLLKLLRWKNLVIIGLTQYLLKYTVFGVVYQTAGVDFSLSNIEFGALVVMTMAIAGGGYIINDIYDYAIDLTNKPDKVIISKSLSLRNAWILYGLSIVISVALAALIDYKVDYIPFITFFSCLFLWLYSYQLKYEPLSGNVVVGIFCASVPFFVWLAEQDSFLVLTKDHPLQAQKLQVVMLFYMIFALLSTLYREVVKDMQDIEGDKQYGCQTLPIKYGLPFAKKATFVLGSLVVIALLIWLIGFRTYTNLLGLIYGTVGLLLPTAYTLYLLYFAEKPHDFGKISSYIKITMLLGLLYLPILFLGD